MARNLIIVFSKYSEEIKSTEIKLLLLNFSVSTGSWYVSTGIYFNHILEDWPIDIMLSYYMVILHFLKQRYPILTHVSTKRRGWSRGTAWETDELDLPNTLNQNEFLMSFIVEKKQNKTKHVFLHEAKLTAFYTSLIVQPRVRIRIHIFFNCTLCIFICQYLLSL